MKFDLVGELDKQYYFSGLVNGEYKVYTPIEAILVRGFSDYDFYIEIDFKRDSSIAQVARLSKSEKE